MAAFAKTWRREQSAATGCRTAGRGSPEGTPTQEKFSRRVSCLGHMTRSLDANITMASFHRYPNLDTGARDPRCVCSLSWRGFPLDGALLSFSAAETPLQ